MQLQKKNISLINLKSRENFLKYLFDIVLVLRWKMKMSNFIENYTSFKLKKD